METQNQSYFSNRIEKDIKNREALHLPLPDFNDMDDEYSDPDLDEYDFEEEQITDFQSLLPGFPKNSDISYKYALEEEKTIPKSSINFDRIQTELTEKHREVAVKCIMQLHFYFRLTNDAYYNSVTYLDICLSNTQIPEAKIQLYAIVCYWIATKVETNFMEPTVEDINKITGHAFTQEEFDCTEIRIVMSLNCKLYYPTSKFFMRFYLTIGSADQEAISIAGGLTEFAMLKIDFFDYKPSVIASAAIVLALESLGKPRDARRVMRIMNHEDIKNIVITMNKFQKYVMARQKSSSSNDIFVNMKLPIKCYSFLG
ncbi:Cyclin, N-terminal domain containing protein [Histomonas meleagridis]|uniref:Cyclin, N-terminal domain containing protein n=1 Tax=Histomonas meleagridis TaxID=135588 RepID=UPI00355AC1DA|nr:Cyclin, N-terminal domain containing protein [Histomonas meleagridis]KAH0804162.1 Cyclin, N-terminal domain containing protein [Histomonas meleagridis]